MVYFDGKSAASWVESESKKLGVSVRRFCKEAGIANSTFCRWKQGFTDPLPISINKIRKFVKEDDRDITVEIIR